MPSVSDTSAIDEKKGEEPIIDDKLLSSIFKFLITLILIIFIFILNFSAGACVLYGCKIAQANILPINEKCMPYASNDIEINEIPINIFETIINEQPLSQKINFSYSKNNSNFVLDMLRNYKENSSSNILFNYFVSIIESIFVLNFSSLSTFLNVLNKIPEYLILIFGPALTITYTSILLFIDFLYAMYLLIYQMSWFFSVNSNSNDSDKPKWETTLNPARIGIGCFFVFAFFMSFWLCLVSISFILPIILFICIVTIISCKGEMNNKDVSVLTIIKDSFKYNKIVISSIISFFVILCSFNKLGGIPGFFSILIVILMYFDVLKIGIFNTIIEENLSRVVSYDQAKRTCKGTKEGLLSWAKSFIGGGKILTHEIKKISKKVKK
jgi:hypothetical protein